MIRNLSENERLDYVFLKLCGVDEEVIEREIKRQRKVKKFVTTLLSVCACLWVPLMVYLFYLLIFVGE